MTTFILDGWLLLWRLQLERAYETFILDGWWLLWRLQLERAYDNFHIGWVVAIMGAPAREGV